MRQRQVYSIFRELNTKIIAYFIAFAFMPLLIFSILGYYLNKNMITRINVENFKQINLNFSNEIRLYFNYKRISLESAVAKCKSKINDQPLDQFLCSYNRLRNDFIAVDFIQNGRYDNIFANQEKYSEFPFVEYKCSEDSAVIGYVSAREIKDLFSDEFHSIFFLKVKKKLSHFGYEPYKTIGMDIPLDITIISNGLVEENDGVLSAYSFLKDENIIIKSQVDINTFYSELLAFRDKIFLANLILAIILIGLAVIYSRHITKPIQELVLAVQNIRKGNLNKKIDLKTNDEIQILAREFELMRQKLLESYQGFEAKLESRTKELQEAHSQITHQEKMASLGLMAAGIAHEIGNPLTSISSMAQVIKRKSSNSKTIEYVNNILKSIDRISRIVRELVDFSKPTTYQTSITDINEVIISAVGMVKYDGRSKNIKYALNLDPNLPKIISVRDHLLQVFLNILINAVDASEGYGNEITVISSLLRKKIIVQIIDQGSGISQDKLKKIFDPFYTTKEIGKGTGLGLTVTYGLVQQLKGEIQVESELKKGSAFSIILPYDNKSLDEV